MAAPIRRLKRRREFLDAAASRRKWVAPGMIVQMRPHGEEELAAPEAKCAGPRVGFTVSRRVGNAVVRNRVRRRLRAVAERVLPRAEPHADYVLIGRQGTVARPFAELVEDLETALARLGALRARP
jgi:ribonuclease P protein component